MYNVQFRNLFFLQRYGLFHYMRVLIYPNRRAYL